MLFLLKVVAGVIIALLLLIVLGFWLIRRWIRRLGATSAATMRLIDARWMRPARLKLAPLTDLEPSDALAARWRELHGLGFRSLGDLQDADNGIVVRAASSEGGLIGAALVEGCGSEAALTFFAIDRQRGLVAISCEPGTNLQLDRLDWRFDARLEPAAAYQALQQQVQGGERVKLDARAFRVAWEQAHATRADRELQQRPRRLAIEQAAAALDPPATPEQIDQAHEMVVDHWHEQLVVALLDHYRRASRIDAVAWEAMREGLHVVHEFVDERQVEAMLVEDDVGRQVLQQCVAQGHKGIALYEQVLQRLPGGARRERVAEVAEPLRGVIYGLREAAASVAAGRYLYEAVQADGTATSGSLIATSSADAKQQARGMGLQSVRILLEPVSSEPPTADLLDPAAAAAAVRAAREGLLVSVLRALRANAWIWVPPAAWLTWELHDGQPTGWRTGLAGVYALAALAALVFLIGPMVIYNQLLRARLAARWRVAAVWLALLRRVSRFSGMSRMQLALEQAKVLAGQGRLQEALKTWQALASTMADAEFHSGLAQIHDVAGDYPRMVEAQRAALIGSPTKDLATVDLALSLARFGDADEAQDLLATVQLHNLSEIAAAGYRIANGVLLARQGQHGQALRQYAQAVTDLEGFKSNPLIVAMIAQTNAFAAISFRRLGQADRAAQLWQHVWPILRVHRGSDRLASEYEAAG